MLDWVERVPTTQGWGDVVQGPRPRTDTELGEDPNKRRTVGNALRLNMLKQRSAMRCPGCHGVSVFCAHCLFVWRARLSVRPTISQVGAAVHSVPLFATGLHVRIGGFRVGVVLRLRALQRGRREGLHQRDGEGPRSVHDQTLLGSTTQCRGRRVSIAWRGASRHPHNDHFNFVQEKTATQSTNSAAPLHPADAKRTPTVSSPATGDAAGARSFVLSGDRRSDRPCLERPLQNMRGQHVLSSRQVRN